MNFYIKTVAEMMNKLISNELACGTRLVKTQVVFNSGVLQKGLKRFKKIVIS